MSTLDELLMVLEKLVVTAYPEDEYAFNSERYFVDGELLNQSAILFNRYDEESNVCR